MLFQSIHRSSNRQGLYIYLAVLSTSAVVLVEHRLANVGQVVWQRSKLAIAPECDDCTGLGAPAIDAACRLLVALRPSPPYRARIA
jgi:hypothetical protein